MATHHGDDAARDRPEHLWEQATRHARDADKKRSSEADLLRAEVRELRAMYQDIKRSHDDLIDRMGFGVAKKTIDNLRAENEKLRAANARLETEARL